MGVFKNRLIVPRKPFAVWFALVAIALIIGFFTARPYRISTQNRSSRGQEELLTYGGFDPSDVWPGSRGAADSETGIPDPQFESECGWVNELARESNVRFHYDLTFRDPCLYNHDNDIPHACGDCGTDYLGFSDRVPPWHRREIDEWTLGNQVGDPARYFGPRVTRPIARDYLAEILADGLNITWLLGETARAPIDVTVVEQTVLDQTCSQVVVIDDPYVGKFAGLWLMPRKRSRSIPTILAVHGHGDSPTIFYDRMHGEIFPKRGFGIYLHAVRGTCPYATEDLIARTLLLHGFSFVALQVYEHDVVTRFLRGLAHVGKIGTLGHSGGAVTANITAIVNPRIAAHVYDSYSTYVENQPDGSYSHAMAPAIWPFHPVINGNYEPGRTPIPRDEPPRLRIPYEPSAKDIGDVADFLDGYLR